MFSGGSGHCLVGAVTIVQWGQWPLFSGGSGHCSMGAVAIVQLEQWSLFSGGSGYCLTGAVAILYRARGKGSLTLSADSLCGLSLRTLCGFSLWTLSADSLCGLSLRTLSADSLWILSADSLRTPSPQRACHAEACRTPRQLEEFVTALGMLKQSILEVMELEKSFTRLRDGRTRGISLCRYLLHLLYLRH